MTTKNFIMVRTPGGRRYAERIANSIRWINENKSLGRGYVFNVHIVLDRELGRLVELVQTVSPENTIIYSRAAYPSRTGWMGNLFRLKELGYTVINDPEVLYLTSHKLECSLKLFNGDFNYPVTLQYNKSLPDDQKLDILNEARLLGERFIVKPVTSIEQGANVKIASTNAREPLIFQVESVPGNELVIQEFVPYSAIYRVIVIGGHALPYSFVDRPTPERWKVSVCLNRTSMEFVPEPNPELLRLGENIQRFIGGEINFIDIFETEPGQFVISEINTACNLRIHELLAKRAGHPKWNIHYYIARYLVERSLNE